MKYLELFAGIGGFRLGINQAYENVQRSKRVQQRGVDRNKDLPNTGEPRLASEPLCIGYSEIDKYAIQVYEKQFPNTKAYGNITTINETKLPDFDLLVGGFPCQTFSIAGKRGGFTDTRGTLFFEIARIIKHKRPRNFILENVKGLLSHDSGKTFQTIIKVLTDLGYCVEWQVLNSKNFGVPQNRERVFIIGHLGGIPERKVFPLGESYGEAECADAKVVPMQWRRTEKGKQARSEAQKRGRDLTPFGDKHRELVRKESSVIGTITSQAIAKDSLLGDNSRVRRLTPMECERLQGFPDNWTEGISDTQRYKMCGNAVSVPVIRAIVEKLLL